MLNPVFVFSGTFLCIGLWEFCQPRRRREFPALRRRSANVGFWLVNIVLSAFVLGTPASARPQLEMLFGVDFLVWPIADAGVSFVAGFLLLDLIRYLTHRCEHAVPLFWRFHALHHSDPDVDMTTAVRHHPVAYVLAPAVYWLAAVVLDIPAIVVLSHGLAVFTMSAVQHGNVRLPEWLERCLQPVLVTVDMHRLHHSIIAEQANSNYGSVLSMWDQLFGTYARISSTQHNTIVFGVHELSRREALKPSAMFLTPWRIARVAAAD